MKRKRMLAVLLAAVLALTAMWGCSSDGASSQQSGGAGAASSKTGDGKAQELTYWGWWSSEARKPYIQEMVNEFNSSQSKYHVTYVDIPFGDIFTKNIAQIAAGNPCDIIANTMEEVKFRASQNQVESLDQYLDDATKGAFYKQYLDACTGENGSVYALPLSVDTRAIFYNKKQFEEAGVKAEEIKTWDDLIAAARKLDVKKGNTFERVGFLPLLGNGGVDTWIINANNGAGFFSEDPIKATINTPTNKEVLKWIRDQIEYYGQAKYDELAAVFKSGMQDPFASGAMSMLVQTSAYTSALKQTAPDLDYGIIPIPEFKSGTGHVANGGGFVIEIPKGAKHPEGSYEFIKYVTSEKTQEFLSEKIGDFSARNDFDESAAFFQNPVNKDLAKCLESTKTLIVPNKIKGYQDVVNPLIDEGVLGKTKTDTALDNAQKALEDFIASNQ